MDITLIPTTISGMVTELKRIRHLINTSPSRSELSQIRNHVKALAKTCRDNRESACKKPGSSHGTAIGAIAGGILGAALGGPLGAAIFSALGGGFGSKFNEQLPRLWCAYKRGDFLIFAQSRKMITASGTKIEGCTT